MNLIKIKTSRAAQLDCILNFDISVSLIQGVFGCQIL